MHYPLALTFKFFAINPQVEVLDAGGGLVLYVRQKAFRLKEDITVYADREQTRPVFTLRADRVFDFSPTFRVADAQGALFGAIRREGLRSLWKTRYEIQDAEGRAILRIHEDNPWVKVLDALVGEVPLVGAFSGYFLHPSYTVERASGEPQSGEPVLRLTKQPSFTERRFRLDKVGDLAPVDEARGLLGLLLMTLLERSRG